MARRSWRDWLRDVRDVATGRAELVDDMGEPVGKGLFGVTFGIPGAEHWTEAYNFVRGLELGTGTRTVTEPYAEHAVVATAIATVAEDAASVDWEAFPRTVGKIVGDDALDTHPVLELFQRPNTLMSGNQLFVGTYTSDLLFGEAFWYYPDYVLPRSNVPKVLESIMGGELWLLDPRTVMIEADRETNEVQYYQRVGGHQTQLDKAKLTHFKRWNPYNPLRGLPMLAALVAEIDGDAAAAKWNERFFSTQNGIPSGLLLPSKREADLTPTQRDETLRMFSRRHGGTQRSVGILPAGWDWKDLGISQREMDFGSLRDYSRELIYGLIGVPPFRAGVLDKANYANAREQDRLYWYGKIQRFVGRYQGTLNHDFLPKIEATDIALYPRWETVKAMIDDLKHKGETARIFHSLGVPLREINDRLDLGFDLDGVEGADKPYLPINMVPAGSSPDSLLSPGQQQTGGEQGQAGAASFNERLKASGASPEEIESQRTMRWRNIIALTTDLARQFESKIRTHFKEIEREVRRNLDSLKGFVATHGTQRRDTQRDVESLMPDKKKTDARIKRMTAPLYRETMKRGGESVISELGLAAEFFDDPAVVAKLSVLVQESPNINKTVLKDLRSELKEGLSQGESVDKLGKRVSGVINASRKRGKVIARTETGKAFSSARMLSMKQVGVRKHEWLSSRDTDVRDSHVLEDGNVVAIGKRFPRTGLLHPVDPGGPPEEIINCRCVALAVVPRR